MAMIEALSAHCKVTVLTRQLLSSLTDVRYHYILILRPVMIPELLANEYFRSILESKRAWPKVIVKSRSALWFSKPDIKNAINEHYHIPSVDWVKQCISKVICQNDLYLKQVKGILPASLVSTNGLAVPITPHMLGDNPYDPNKSYIPTSAIGSLDKTNKRIIIYIGSAKADNGKVLQTMADIMKALGPKYELHLFLTTFLLPHSRKKCSGNAHLPRLKDTVFSDCSNVVLHHGYRYHERYEYIYYADCAIDFSTSRNSKGVDRSEHLRLVEYCEMGIPVVCEDKIINGDLVEGIKVSHNASPNDYANAIKQACEMTLDRDACKNKVIARYSMVDRAKELFETITHS